MEPDTVGRTPSGHQRNLDSRSKQRVSSTFEPAVEHYGIHVRRDGPRIGDVVLDLVHVGRVGGLEMLARIRECPAARRCS